MLTKQADYVIASNWSWGVEAVNRGRHLLEEGAPALDVVEETIRLVEDDPRATSVGTGGLPNAEGKLELDASIMDGTNLRAGGVAALQMTKNPISVARKVMERTPHILLAGDGARQFARRCGLPEYDPLTPAALETWNHLKELMLVNPPQAHVDNRKEVERLLGYNVSMEALARSLRSVYAGHLGGTVGVLVRDTNGGVAAGASTSGWPMRFPGRVADTSIIGAGVYATKTAAATCTGVGEISIRHSLAKHVCDLVETGLAPSRACEAALKQIMRLEKVEHLLAVVCINADCETGGATTRTGFQYQYATQKQRRMVIERPEPVVGIHRRPGRRRPHSRAARTTRASGKS